MKVKLLGLLSEDGLLDELDDDELVNVRDELELLDVLLLDVKVRLDDELLDWMAALELDVELLLVNVRLELDDELLD